MFLKADRLVRLPPRHHADPSPILKGHKHARTHFNNSWRPASPQEEKADQMAVLHARPSTHRKDQLLALRISATTPRANREVCLGQP